MPTEVLQTALSLLTIEFYLIKALLPSNFYVFLQNKNFSRFFGPLGYKYVKRGRPEGRPLQGGDNESKK